MKIKITECVGNSRIYREDGTLAGTIEGWPKNGPVRKICGADGSVIYRVRKENGRCVVESAAKTGSAAVNAVPFQYKGRPESEGAGDGPSALFRAPLVLKALVPLESGNVSIRQNRKREFVLEDESGDIGRITKIGSLSSHEVECGKELGIYDAAVVFVVAEYMYHDDDVEVV